MALEHHGGIKVYSDFTDARTACEFAISIKANVVLLDCCLKGNCAFEAVRWLRSQNPKIKALFTDNVASAEHYHRAVECGASGYLEKTCSCKELVVAIERITRGEQYFPTHYAPLPGQMFHLTPREREIVKLLAEGLNSKQIAMVLGISADTVTTHKYNIMKKLAIHNRVELVRFAIVNKIVEAEITS